MSPDISYTLFSKFSFFIISVMILIDKGFLSKAITFISTSALLAASRADRIKGPRPAPKYKTTIGFSKGLD